MSILELIPGSQDSNLRVLSAELNGLERILKTGSVTIAYQDVVMKQKIQENLELNQRITLELLDFSKDTSADSLKGPAYDVILTSGFSNVIQKPAMAGGIVSKLLKVGGKLCILEADNITEKIKDLLHKSQMETMVIHNGEETQAKHLNLIIARRMDVSRADGATETSRQNHVSLIQMPNPSKLAQAVASYIAMSLERYGYTATLVTWSSDLSQLSSSSCISLVELEKPFLRDLTAQDFASVQQLVLGATKILWVVGFGDPSAAMIDGLARTVRNETPGLSFCTFHAEEHCSSSPASLGDLIARVFGSTTGDDEFLLKDQLLHVSRIEEDETLNEQINNILPGAQDKISRMPLGQVQYPTKLCIQTPGMLDSLCLEPDDLPRTELVDDFVEIQVKATALK